jgi:hypothetical protein
MAIADGKAEFTTEIAETAEKDNIMFGDPNHAGLP